MDTYCELVSEALKSGNLEELQCLLTGWKNESLEYRQWNTIPRKLGANEIEGTELINLEFQEKWSFFSKEMCYVSMHSLINYYINERTNPLHNAVRLKSTEAVRLLLKHGANPNTFQYRGYGTTLLHALLELKALCFKYKSQQNPEFCASKLKDIIKLLIDFDADLYNLTPDGLPFLHVAVTGTTDYFTEMYDIISSQTCFDINYQIPFTSKSQCSTKDNKIKYNAGDTALHALAKSGNGDIATGKALLKYGINPNIRNMNGCTALHYSLNKHNDYAGINELLPVLLEAGCDPNVQVTSYDGRFEYLYSGVTSLHIAIQPHNNQVYLRDIKLLLQHGGNLDIVDCYNNSPMVYFYKNVINQGFLKQGLGCFEVFEQQMKNHVDIFQVLMSGGAVTRRALEEVSSLKLKSRQNFEYMILTFYTHTWLFKTLVDIRYPFLLLNKTSEHYQLYSIPQSLKRLSAMVLYSSLKPNVWCGIKKLQVPASIRDYVTLGRIETLFSATYKPIYSDKHWQDILV